jgi:hypothetical protein
MPISNAQLFRKNVCVLIGLVYECLKS